MFLGFRAIRVGLPINECRPTNHGTFEAKDPDVDCENPIARDAYRWWSAVSCQALALRCVKCLRRSFAEPHAPGLKALKWRDR